MFGDQDQNARGYFRIAYGDCGIDSLANITANVASDSCFGKIVPDFQTFPNSMSYRFVNNEGTYIRNSVSTSSGTTVNISPNAMLFLSSGVSLTFGGVMHANGTSAQPITFLPYSGTSPGSWGSIVINGSGASGSNLTYCNIQYGTQVAVLSANNVTIQNCSITNSSTNGIWFYSSTGSSALNNSIVNGNLYHPILIQYSTNVTCQGNTILKSNHIHRGAGIYYMGANGNAGQNDIAYVEEGFRIISGSSPHLYNSNNDGRNNRVMNCSYGFDIFDNSYPIIGEYDYSPNYCYRGNSIHDNTWDILLNTAYSTVSDVDALGVYWNGGDPQLAYISTGAGSHVYNDVFIDTDPWASYDPLSSRVPDNPQQLHLEKVVPKSISARMATTQSTSPVGPSRTDPLSEGIALQQQGKFREAKDFFVAYITKHPEYQRAYVELYGCANQETLPGIIEFFESLPKEAAEEQKLLLSHLCLIRGDVKSAKQVNAGIITQNPNTSLSAQAELSDFFISLHNENDFTSASAILGQLQKESSLISPTELSLAQMALETYVDPKTGQMAYFNAQPKELESSSKTPSTDGITGNYPNPFNPSTQIRFAVKQAGLVSLRVYDLLGREVATLVNEIKSPGTYNVDWNASQFASGIYFARFETAGRVAIQKLLYLK